MADEAIKTVRDATYAVGLQFVRLVLDEIIREYYPEEEWDTTKAAVNRHAPELTILRNDDGTPLIPGFHIGDTGAGAHILFSTVTLPSYTVPKLKDELRALGLSDERINHLLSLVLSIPRLAFRTFVANYQSMLRDLLGSRASEDIVKRVLDGELSVDTETLTFKLITQNYGLRIIVD